MVTYEPFNGNRFGIFLVKLVGCNLALCVKRYVCAERIGSERNCVAVGIYVSLSSYTLRLVDLTVNVNGNSELVCLGDRVVKVIELNTADGYTAYVSAYGIIVSPSLTALFK